MQPSSAISPYSISRMTPAVHQQPSPQIARINCQWDSSPLQQNATCESSLSTSAQEKPTLAMAPSCHLLPTPPSDTNTLPSQQIPKTKLLTPQAILQKYSKLRGEALAGVLAVKLAREAYFGPEVMKKCTVRGSRSLPGLPHTELCQLKQTVFSSFPQYWANPVEFEPVWTKCSAAVGQACKALRSKCTS